MENICFLNPKATSCCFDSRKVRHVAREADNQAVVAAVAMYDQESVQDVQPCFDTGMEGILVQAHHQVEEEADDETKAVQADTVHHSNSAERSAVVEEDDGSIHLQAVAEKPVAVARLYNRG